MLESGTMLGPYQIVGKLGAGGMGEVYRARDTRLGRDVAVKVLPPHLAETPEARARFDREARTISQLNHPHICTLHDIGRQDGLDYLVMELVEGDTLARRLEKGPLPVAEVLALGVQIAQALERAHRAGVVHRDLKPGNIMLTKGGAKLLDFGLARALGPASTPDAPSQSPTMTGPLTAEGKILGTFQYMSPEQLEGRDADARSDLWALGCVLYEMTTGARAFAGASQASLIAAIMDRQPPPLSAVTPVTPPHLERVVTRCLQKDPDARFQSAGDLAFALDPGSSGTVVTDTRPPAPARPARRRRGGVLVVVALAALVAGGLLGVALSRRAGVAPVTAGRDVQSVRRWDLVLPDSLPLTYVGESLLGLEMRALALSPRADRLVYVTGKRGRSRLATLDLTTGEARPLPGTQGAYCPFFSPDGAWIGFLAQTELKKIAWRGAAPIVLAALDEPYGALWYDAERILAFERQGMAFTFVRAGGGRLETAKAPRRINNAQMLAPDRPEVVWSLNRQLVALDVKSGRVSFLSAHGLEPDGPTLPTDLLFGNTPVLLTADRLLYVPSGSGGTLMGIPVERGSLRPLADPVQVATDLRQAPIGNLAQLSVAAGVVVYAADPGSGSVRFVRRRAGGQVEPLALLPGDYGAFELSPDGHRLAVIKRPPAGPPELWVFDLTRGTQERVHDGVANPSAWSVDGRGLYVTVEREDGARVGLRLRLDGTGAADTILTAAAANSYQVGVASPDGRWMLRVNAGGGVLTGADGRETVFPNLSSLARFSPDSRWLAATYSEGDRSEVFVASVDEPGHRIRVSTAGGEEPRWSADGRSIVYRFENGWYRVAFRPGSPPTVEMPEALFTGPYVNVPGYSHDVFPDGSQLLLLDSGSDETHRLQVVTGLEALIRRGE